MLLVYVAFPDQLVEINLTIVRSLAPSNLISPACLPVLLTLERTPANFISELLFFLFYILKDNFVINYSARMMKVVSRKLGNRSLQYLIDNWPDEERGSSTLIGPFPPPSLIFTLFISLTHCAANMCPT